MQYVQSDFELLEVMVKAKSFGPYQGLTIKELVEKSNYSHTKIRSSMRVLIANKYLQEGFMNRNAKTYYVTDEGIELMKDLSSK